MRIENISDVTEFFKIVDECKGRVELLTGEGDRLNLKSKLCQVIGLTKLVEGGVVGSAKIVCEKPEDESLRVCVICRGEE